MQLVKSHNGSLAVIDVETTGLGRRDRVVEVAVVLLDCNGEVLDEYDTLVNPERDVGPTEIHGITPAMVSAAPTFSEIAASLASRLDEAVLVAHNLSFDSRFLANEFSRLDARFNPGQGICTLQLTGERLNMACERNDISLSVHHRALTDTRATAQLLKAIVDEEAEAEPATIQNLTAHPNPRTLRRDALGGRKPTLLHRIVSTTRECPNRS